MFEVIERIQQAAVDKLGQMATRTIASVERQVVDTIGDFRVMSQHSSEVITRFETNLNNNFDELLGKEVFKEDPIFNFETLSLVQEEELDVMVALEGMVNAARNEHLAVFISFNTRLAALFPGKRIDESSNPLDPEQLATAFQESLRPLGLDAQNSLTVYRAFNVDVLKNLDQVLNEANRILIDSGVLPDLGMEGQKHRNQPVSARTIPRVDPTSPFGTVEETAPEAEQVGAEGVKPELFSMMQNLLHTETRAAPAAAGTALPRATPGEAEVMIPASMLPMLERAAATMQPFEPKQGQNVQMVDQAKLMDILNDIQAKLSALPASDIPGSIDQVEKLNIAESLGEMLQADSDENSIAAVDRQSSDIINLVTLLFEAIWHDSSVPIPIKELIGRTQVTIIKVALADVDFFNDENHPARAVLNEFAAAGIGWAEVEDLEQDPLYQKISELVDRMLRDYSGDIELFDNLIRDFRNFRSREAAKTRQLEQRILRATERNERIDDINELVTQKIDERILGRELDAFVEDLLRGPFHKFMVMLVLKEGPGSTAWKQSVNTIDVLLWSVQQHDHKDDRNRLDTVNPRLINNLRKAFRIASIDRQEIDSLIDRLQAVQRQSFDEDLLAESESSDSDAQDQPAGAVQFLKADDESRISAVTTEAKAAATAAVKETAEEDIPEATFGQVDTLAVGQWVEFAGETEDSGTRCKLAAKINAIDKFIFVNRQGVKVVEKTRGGLARELHEGTVSIISDGLLFSRALESVIGNLRESQHEQQTGSAYQPGQDESIPG